MTGYNTAHGDTAAVRLDLLNYLELYTEYRRCVDRAVWSEDSRRWEGVDDAAAALRAHVSSVQAGGGEYAEIIDADLTGVDFRGLICRELAERNLEAGRDEGEGL